MIGTRRYPEPELRPAFVNAQRYRTVLLKQKPLPHQNPYGHGGLGSRMTAGTGASPAQLEREERRRHADAAAEGRTCAGKCAICAVDAMHAARPAKPMTGRPEVVPASAAAIALAKDRRAGLVGEWGF